MNIMKFALEIKEGERIYQIIRSPWLKDAQGNVLFKLLSKVDAKGEIESAIVVERNGGYKTIIARTTVSEDKFPDVLSAFRSLVWQVFPNVDLKVEEVGEINKNTKSNTQYTVANTTKWGLFKLWLKKHIRF